MVDKANEQRAESRLSEGVLVQVCVECGKEYFYEDEQPPANQQCEKCGNLVFRSFFHATDGDEAVADFNETTGRDVTPEDPATDVTRGDLYDLNNP
jgi:DNA-directed RNA polymerase subunit RPC12/RpoP